MRPSFRVYSLGRFLQTTINIACLNISIEIRIGQADPNLS